MFGDNSTLMFSDSYFVFWYCEKEQRKCLLEAFKSPLASPSHVDKDNFITLELEVLQFELMFWVPMQV